MLKEMIDDALQRKHVMDEREAAERRVKAESAATALRSLIEAVLGEEFLTATGGSFNTDKISPLYQFFYDGVTFDIFETSTRGVLKISAASDEQEVFSSRADLDKVLLYIWGEVDYIRRSEHLGLDLFK